MRKLALIVLAILLVAVVGGNFTVKVAASAAFNPNDLITDSIFANSAAMSAGQIDAFLNSNPNSCLSSNANSNGNPGFMTPDPEGWSVSQNQYVFGGNVTAGQAIYDAAQLYSVNPEVILTTMQKEQSLVTGSAGCHYNSPDPSTATPMTNSCGSGTRNCTLACTYAGGCMNIAMGYGCPGYCNAADEGFGLQLTLGTWLLRFGQQRAYGILTGYQGYEPGDENFCYTGPMVAGTRQRSASSATCGGQPGNTPTYYDGSYTTQDGTSITVATGATASLYNFTPFVSGNQNFVNIFEGWFGPTVPVDLTGSPTAVSWGAGRIDVFVRGSDGNLWQKWFDNSGGWRSWGSLDVPISSSPAVSSWASGRLDIFYVNSSGALGHYWFDNGSWQSVESLGQPASNVTITGSPTAVSWGAGRIDVFVRGSDGNLWQKWFDNSGGWRPWNRIGANIVSSPAVSSWASGRLDIFANGPNGTLQHYWFDGTNWNGWESLGAPSVGLTTSIAPSVVSWGAGRIDVFERAGDGAIWQEWFDSSGGWRPWNRIGGAIISAPAVSSWQSGRLDIFGIGNPGDLQHYWFDGTNWNGWESLGTID